MGCDDGDSFPLIEQDVIDALENAVGGPVEEGCVGGGTGMICYDFKGGKGVPVGRILDERQVPKPQLFAQPELASAPNQHRIDSSSILVVIATDAPLLPEQCKRLARRATVGLSRTGGVGYNSSGDLFLAFSTGNHYDPNDERVIDLRMLQQSMLDPLIEATAEVVEESILNALASATTTKGFMGRIVHALPLKAFVDLMNR